MKLPNTLLIWILDASDQVSPMVKDAVTADQLETKRICCKEVFQLDRYGDC